MIGTVIDIPSYFKNIGVMEFWSTGLKNKTISEKLKSAQ